MPKERHSPEDQVAVALRYDPTNGDSAPRVVATGQGHIADEIIRLAKLHQVAFREDPALCGALASLEPGTTVPAELFRAVAEVLAFVYKMNDSVRGR